MNEVLQHFNAQNANQDDEPGWVFWVCYQVYHSIEDERANDVLAEANLWLSEQAQRIKDKDMRESFENIEVNVRLKIEANDVRLKIEANDVRLKTEASVRLKQADKK